MPETEIEAECSDGKKVMPIMKGEQFRIRDVYVDYEYEGVMFRWDHRKKRCYGRFYGESEGGKPVRHDSELFNEALLYGEEISQANYEQGKPPSGKKGQ